MKQLRAIAFAGALLLTSCAAPDKEPSNKLAPLQIRLNEMVDDYTNQLYQAPNEIQRQYLIDSLPHQIHRYLMDSANLRMKDCYVTVDEITLKKMGSVNAFYATFSDADPAKRIAYWMEWDYDPADDKKFRESEAFKVLEHIRPGTDTTLNFLYLGEVELSDYYSTYPTMVKVRVTPITTDSVTAKAL